MKIHHDWETIANAILLILLFAGLVLYSVHLEGEVAKLEARVSTLEATTDVKLTKIDQKLTQALKVMGIVWRP